METVGIEKMKKWKKDLKGIASIKSNTELHNWIKEIKIIMYKLFKVLTSPNRQVLQT